MLTKLRASLTYANVTATVAIFVALGGTSYAVATGSIDSRELKNNGVRSKDIRNNDVRSKDIRDRSLLRKDFKSGQLPCGACRPAGPEGRHGPVRASAQTDARGRRSVGAVVGHCGGERRRLRGPPGWWAGPSRPAAPSGGAGHGDPRALYRHDGREQPPDWGSPRRLRRQRLQQLLLAGGSSDTPSEGVTTLTTDPGVTLPPVSDTSYYNLYAQRALSDPGGRLAFCGVAVDYTLG